jgi:hypothetical protein
MQHTDTAVEVNRSSQGHFKGQLTPIGRIVTNLLEEWSPVVHVVMPHVIVLVT